MTNAVAATGFAPAVMTPDLCSQLLAEGYNMPDSWPFPARVVTDQRGWKLEQPGSLNPESPSFCGKDAYFPEPVYVAPDGSKYSKATNGARVVLVSLSKRMSPSFLRVTPGTRRPQWVIEDTPKGEIPEHLKAYLLQPGEKLERGQKRLPKAKVEEQAKVQEEAEQFAVEPTYSTPTSNGKKGSKVTVDYANMTDAQVKEWANERASYWRARAYQIEKQGVKGFQSRVRQVLGVGTQAKAKAKLAPKTRAVTKGKAAKKGKKASKK